MALNPVQAYYNRWLRHKAKRFFDFGRVQMSVEEFLDRCQQVDCLIPEAPNPPIQIAELDTFRWNPEVKWAILDEVWKSCQVKLARKHLSERGFRRFLSGFEPAEKARLVRRAGRAKALNTDAKRRGQGAKGFDALIRSERAREALHVRSDGTSKRVQEYASLSVAECGPTRGLCANCPKRFGCAGAQNGIVRCPDYPQPEVQPIGQPC
ncbi:MAG: hypothetical protein PHI12_13925 [Dehalococcoidales bacterium]|nr:hypothetical protein [Dehalococcoidales bacterium]